MAAYFKPFFIFVIFVTMCCMGMCEDTDSLDFETMDAKERNVGIVTCLDSNGYGFVMYYRGSKPITPKRASEMRSRESFLNMQERLKRDVAVKFPDLSNIDIYEFAYFVRQYDSFSKDYCIESIFVAGETRNFYKKTNPKLEGGAYTFPNNAGMLYIDNPYIYGEVNQKRIYFYFGAKYPWNRSFRDEKVTHVTQEEAMRCL